jgi:hypothetical protein
MTTLQKIQTIWPTLKNDVQRDVMTYISDRQTKTYFEMAPQYVRDSVLKGFQQIKNGEGIDGRAFFKSLDRKIDRAGSKSAK